MSQQPASQVEIVSGPLPPREAWAFAASAGGPGAAGAVLIFEGIVRAREGERAIAGLTYQTYEPMAHTMLDRIATEVVSKHGLLGLWVRHSRGFVPVGACSFRLVIASAHRKEGLAAMDEFIDLLKRDVPIWKAPEPGP